MRSGYNPLADKEDTPAKRDQLFTSGNGEARVTRATSAGVEAAPMGLPAPSVSSSSEASMKVDAALQEVSKSEGVCIHTVRETDTLPRISILYGVPIGLIRRMNRLTSDEIWFRKTLKIPLPEGATLPSPVASPNSNEADREEGAAKAQKISALKKICPRLSSLGARQLLEASSWDLWRANTYGDWLTKMSAHGEIDWREALAYLEMYSYDMAKAEKHLRDDIEWEVCQKKSSCCAPPRAQRGKEHLSDDEESLCAAFSPRSFSTCDLGPRRRLQFKSSGQGPTRQCQQDTELAGQASRSTLR